MDEAPGADRRGIPGGDALVLLDRDLPAADAPDRVCRWAEVAHAGLPVPPFGLLTATSVARIARDGLPRADYVIPGPSAGGQDPLDLALALLWHHSGRGGLVPVRVGPVDRAAPPLTGHLVKSWDHLRRAVVDTVAAGGEDHSPILVVRSLDALHRGSIDRSRGWRPTTVTVAMESTIGSGARARRVSLRRGRWLWRRPRRAHRLLPRDLRHDIGIWSRTVISDRGLDALGWTIDPGGEPWIVDLRLR